MLQDRNCFIVQIYKNIFAKLFLYDRCVKIILQCQHCVAVLCFLIANKHIVNSFICALNRNGTKTTKISGSLFVLKRLVYYTGKAQDNVGSMAEKVKII